MHRAVLSLSPRKGDPPGHRISPAGMRKWMELLQPGLGNESTARPQAGKYLHTHPHILHILLQRPGTSRNPAHSEISQLFTGLIPSQPIRV